MSVHALAVIQQAKGDSACATAYLEALELARSIDDKVLQATSAFNLGSAHLDIGDLRDLDEAERCFRKSLDLLAAHDAPGRGKCLGQLGKVALARFVEGHRAKQPTAELARYLEDAAHLYVQALEMKPEANIITRGAIHNSLALSYQFAGSTDHALHHYGQGIRYCEEAGDIFSAGRARRNVASALLAVGRVHDALAYAEAALANFLSFGDRAAAEIQKTEELIATMKEAQAKERGNT